ncbi:hypothetical protein VT84_21860 [Gemmata sp. SH-PL17]|uniref:hypothetical protein n=1 Tax=Gemmata sp. SH-PL17 TaxID=1630693 RepID=UPI0006984B8E|nr:hypothetical protein [Gemmata sp. SH-PL17]AMV27063.1 hypothetical protein VT84_21860 [Gemmata sp. SH-PL17]
MPSILSDPPPVLYLILAVALAVTGAIAAKRQDRKSAIPFGIAALLLLLVLLIDRLYDSPREEAVRRLTEMGAAANAKNPDTFVKQVADKVSVQTDTNQTKVATRDELKKSAFWGMLRQFQVAVTVSGFSRDDVKVIDDNTIELGFIAKAEAEGKTVPVYMRATFGKQSDGSFKLTALKAFEFIDRTKVFSIPNFP